MGKLLQPAIDFIQSPSELLNFFAELLQFLLVAHRSGYTPFPQKSFRARFDEVGPRRSAVTDAEHRVPTNPVLGLHCRA